MSTKDKALPVCSEDTALVGKGGVQYLKHGAFCLETQKYPDAVHHVTLQKEISLPFALIYFIFSLQENFPSTILNPGTTYKHSVVFKFGVNV